DLAGRRQRQLLGARRRRRRVGHLGVRPVPRDVLVLGRGVVGRGRGRRDVGVERVGVEQVVGEIAPRALRRFRLLLQQRRVVRPGVLADLQVAGLLVLGLLPAAAPLRSAGLVLVL